MLGDEIHQFDLLASIQVKMENEQQQPVIVVTDHSDDIQSSGGKELVQALFLCAPFLPKKGNVHLFSSSFSRFDKCHETSRIFPRNEQTFASARSFGVIS